VELGAEDDALFFIHVEKLHGSPADLRRSDDLGTDHRKMIFPAVESRTEQFNQLA
jgi:hypothetical protein